uniref:Uncharacterized protein n=1 Tax=Panagrolaimus superbus TaxID=310955 RepID=A0A914Z6U0_9BILA
MVRISEEGPESEMKKYQQDEKALIESMQFQNSSILWVPEIPADIVVLGLINSGKSIVANALEKLEFVNDGTRLNEISYDEMDTDVKIIE